jgi:hypothetical protein
LAATLCGAPAGGKEKKKDFPKKIVFLVHPPSGIAGA